MSVHRVALAKALGPKLYLLLFEPFSRSWLVLVERVSTDVGPAVFTHAVLQKKRFARSSATHIPAPPLGIRF